MTIPARTTLTAAIATRLEEIARTDGYRTGIGDKVVVGARRANENEAPCIVLTPGAETPPADAGRGGHVQIGYTVNAYLNRIDEVAHEYAADPHADFALIDAAIADVRDAIEGADCALSAVALSVIYLGATPFYPEDGGELCGAELRYAITTPYVDSIPGQ